jgi:pectin methylesterase-like acyl-CoA thioesterase
MNRRQIICSLATCLVGLVGLPGFIGLRADAQQARVVVDAAGHGDFRTIQEAINSLPDSAAVPRTIFIRNGVYHEKVFIEKNNIVLEGENREQTTISWALQRYYLEEFEHFEYVWVRSFGRGRDNRVCS